MKVKINEGFILREYAGEFCVFEAAHSNDGAVEGLPSFPPDGVFLWETLLRSGAQEVPALAARLAVHSDLHAEEAEMDVQEFLARLINAGIASIC